MSNPYPKGSLLEWVYDEMMSAQQLAHYAEKQLERYQRDIARWQELLELLDVNEHMGLFFSAFPFGKRPLRPQ